jgi:diguanylate cyclase (GGDEF)-like protein
MKIDIPGPLYEQYQKLVKEMFCSDDVPEYIHKLIESELRRFYVPGYELDALTNCKTRYQLECDVNRATLGSSSWDHSIFRSNYLCLDIDNFKSLLDVCGLSTGDEILREIARQLHANYANANVYRFGGDEFVVQLAEERYLHLELPSEITLKHSIVKVAAERNQRRNHYVNRVIMFHLDKGIVDATREGNEIICVIDTT